jgi:Domain of unknown function (DUF4112)
MVTGSESMTTEPLKPIIERGPSTRPGPGATDLEVLAWLMDRAIRIPGTRITVGLDALIGLLPIGGDFLTGLIQVGIVLVALYRYRVPRLVAARMAANVLLDTLLGAIPLVGDTFDVFFKANTRNLRLLHQVQQDQSPRRIASTWASAAYLVGIAAILLIPLILVLIGFITVFAWLLHRPAA